MHLSVPHVPLRLSFSFNDFSLSLSLSLVIHVSSSGSSKLFASLVGVCFGQAPAMDARMQKRYASVQHIKQQWYYRPGVVDDEPDPGENCPTRMWRFKMLVWVIALKRAFQDQEPRHEDAAPDLMAGSE